MGTRVKRYFGVLDSLDADAVASFCTRDAVVRLPGTVPIIGKEAIRKALVRFSLGLDELHHAPVLVWTAGSLSVFEADVTLTLTDRSALTFPVTHIIRWSGDLIEEASINIYLESRLELAMSAFDRLWRVGPANLSARDQLAV